MAFTTSNTNASLAEIVAAYIASGKTWYLAFGTGTGTAGAGDTALGTEDTSLARTPCSGATGSMTATQVNVAGDTITATATAQFGASAKLYTEYGWFDALTGGTLMLHATACSYQTGPGGVTNLTLTGTYTL